MNKDSIRQKMFEPEWVVRSSRQLGSARLVGSTRPQPLGLADPVSALSGSGGWSAVLSLVLWVLGSESEVLRAPSLGLVGSLRS